MRDLTQEEREEIKAQSKLIEHYRTGILLAKMKIKMIEEWAQTEEWEKLTAEPLEF